MQQRRSPFIVALIFSISLLSLAVIVSAIARTGPLNRHPHGDKHLGRGRGTLKTPNSPRNFRKSIQGVAGRAHHHRRSGGIGHVHHNHGQPGKAYEHHSGAIGNAQQNQDRAQSGKAYGNYSGVNASTQQNVQAEKSNSIFDYGNGSEGTIDSEVLAQEFLLAHNLVREKFHQPLYEWDKNLALYAQTHATTLSHHCEMIHSEGPYGENIFWGLNLHWKPQEAVMFWYEEYKNYDFNSHTCTTGNKCGHFTQMVWRDSVRLGCAVHICRRRTGMLMICEYDPPGNYENENPFDNNNAKQ